jgi:hypothetical protein
MYFSDVYSQVHECDKLKVWQWFTIGFGLVFGNRSLFLFCFSTPEVPDDFGEGIALMRRHRTQLCTALTFRVGRMLIPVSLLLVLAAALPAKAEKAVSADAFVDSLGVNIHLHFNDTAYANFPRVQQALKDLGVRHVRDGLVDTAWKDYYSRHNQLGRMGIKGTFITSPAQSTQLLLDYPERMKDSFEAYEAPNEYDQSHDAQWSATLTSFLSRLNRAVKADARTSRFPVIGPSLTRADSALELRGLCTFDYANLHNYFGGHNPGTPGWGSNGYGSILRNLAVVNTICPGKLVVTTETGYQTSTALPQGIPEDVAGKYVPRVFLEQWLHGIRRTYLYELVDLPPRRSAGDSAFGLLRFDFTPKPAYSALKNLLQLLADPGPAFAGEELGFKLRGELSNVHHLLFEKRNGVFYLAFWVEEPGYDSATKKATPAEPHAVVIQTDRVIGMTRHWFDASGEMHAAALDAAATHKVEVSDSVTIFEMDSRPAAPLLNPPVVSHNIR